MPIDFVQRDSYAKRAQKRYHLIKITVLFGSHSIWFDYLFFIKAIGLVLTPLLLKMALIKYNLTWFT